MGGIVIFLWTAHQAVFVAVKVQLSHPSQLQPDLGISLGVQLHQMNLVRSEPGNKRDEMTLGHLVVNGNEMLIFHFFDGDSMALVTVLGIQRRQGHTAAAYHNGAAGMENIAANGSNIEF